MIGKIFLDNFKRLKGRIVAIVIVCGLVIIPSLYAWFSLLAFWDPDANTGALDVAVVNNDEGYQSALIPVKVDAGAQVTNDLRANTDFHWIFTGEEEALEGVRSGEYYAAIVIPKDFSANLMTVFSNKIEHSKITYYVNQKENPIASEVTSEGASDLQAQIDQSFSKVVSDIALETTSNLSNFMDGGEIETYATTLIEQLEQGSDQLRAAANQSRSFADLLNQSQTLVGTQANLFAQAETISGNIAPTLSNTRDGLNNAMTSISDLSGLMDQTFGSLKSSLEKMKASADDALNALRGDPAALEGLVSDLKSDVVALRGAYEQVRGDIEQTDPNSALLPTIDRIIGELNQLEASLNSASEQLAQGEGDIDSAQQTVDDAFGAITQAIDSIQGSYEENLKGEAEKLGQSLTALCDAASLDASQLGDVSASLDSIADSLSGNIDDARSSLESTAQLLDDSASSVSQTKDDLAQALSSGNLDEVRRIIGDNPEDLAQSLSAPVDIDEHTVYPMRNYGSAMSPFYTSLAIFIGSLFLVIILKVSLTPRRREELGNPTLTQEYFGNLLFFLVLSLAQALLICTGELFYLGIQCDNIALYYLTGMVSSFVFCNIVYAFTVAFGNVGKAIAVIYMVMQIAGCGGEFPIQLSSELFQLFYPWLPFTHSMAAFQGAMAGIYGNQFIVALICLLAFVVPALIIGLVLRRPIKRLNDFVSKQLEETKIL